MANQILFLHGGGSTEDYEADKKLVESLRSHLGSGYLVHYPFLPNDGSPDLGRRRQIIQELSESVDGVIVAAHSLGASMLLACLSEFQTSRKIGGIFLTATPFWEGDEDWVEAFKLRPDFSEKLDQNIPLFFYHCLDDEEVSISHMGIYKQRVPWATFREIPAGGHQLGEDLLVVAEDIRSVTN